MKKWLDRFACVDSYPEQTLKKTFDGGYVWDIGSEIYFKMHFDNKGVFLYSLQENIEGGIVKITKPNGKAVSPLTEEQMELAQVATSTSE